MSDEIINVNAVYIGREFHKKGTGDKGDWKQFKSKWQVDGQDKVWTFWVFDPLGKSKHRITEIEEGERYSLGYIETQIDRTDDNGNPIKIKKLIGINDERLNEAGGSPQTGQTEEGVPTGASHGGNPVSSNIQKKGGTAIEKFKEAYKNQFDESKQSVYHFILTYLVNEDSDLKPIVKKLKEEYNKTQDVVIEDV